MSVKISSWLISFYCMTPARKDLRRMLVSEANRIARGRLWSHARTRNNFFYSGNGVRRLPRRSAPRNDKH
ncbi:hypothetical protein Desti_2939 [Desulfomonile tiedjei DSM 6799]|uniref:Uncharacterized protein n=1 Tax=Desulfomonile tiedjei (strain ATCC 49306 / DSM 6799 / DCB-1) TaxID=706587 RepID=I4C7R7_DESTA|nr:hypothetical protein Desti_2939 [Desulfomonile tiedjei DSM 6799]